MKVTKNARTGMFEYDYRVFNPPTNTGQIRGVDIEITRGVSDAILSRQGLVNGPGYARHSSEDAFQRVPMVPVGIGGPEGWLYGLGFDNDTPPHGFAGWGSTDEPFRILPGRTLSGFRLTSYGLPGIRQVQVRPAVEPPEGLSGWTELNAFYEQFTFRALTISPKAPPQPFVPLEFLNYLITILHDSRQHGWVREAEEAKELLKILRQAKRRLEANEPTKAAKRIEKFLKEVKEESCQDFRCRKDKALTSEAYALLFFNGQFLLERLPPPSRERGDDDDD